MAGEPPGVDLGEHDDAVARKETCEAALRPPARVEPAHRPCHQPDGIRSIRLFIRTVDAVVADIIQVITDGLPKRPVPLWLRLDTNNLIGEITNDPEPTEIDTGIDSRLIVEFYSK